MAYTTVTKVRMIINYNDRIDSGSIPDSSATEYSLTQAITDADDYINGKLAMLYTVPFASTPPVIDMISKNMAIYFLLLMIYTSERPAESDWVTTYKTNADDLLQMILDRKLTLTDASNNVIAIKATQGIVSTTEKFAPTMALDDPVNWELSRGREDEIDEGRDADT